MNAPIRRRTRAREIALQFLYLQEMRGEEAMEEFEPFFAHHSKRGSDRKGTREVSAFGRELVLGVREHREELNHWIERIARNWRLERMAHVDRNVLRLALYELLYHADIPFKVVINEAIDIAKRYSTTHSGSFVNGILDRARVLIEERRSQGKDVVPPPSPDEVQGPARSLRPVPGEVPAPVPRPRTVRPQPPARPSGD